MGSRIKKTHLLTTHRLGNLWATEHNDYIFTDQSKGLILAHKKSELDPFFTGLGPSKFTNVIKSKEKKIFFWTCKMSLDSFFTAVEV